MKVITGIRIYLKIHSKEITIKERKGEQPFLHMTDHLDMIYNPIKPKEYESYEAYKVHSRGIPQTGSQCVKKQVGMIRKYHNHALQTIPRHHGTSHRTITITRHQEDNQSKATSSLFPIKMIAKLEMTQSNAQQNMEQT